MKRRDKDIRWSKLETGLPRPVAKKRFNPPQPDDQPHPDAVMSADQAARQDSTSGTAAGKVAGRLAGLEMPGRVGFPLARPRAPLTICSTNTSLPSSTVVDLAAGLLGALPVPAR